MLTNRDLAAALLALWPNLIAYLLSFAVIGIMWQHHHALLRTVEAVDRKTVFWNLLLLGGTVFIPSRRARWDAPTAPAGRSTSPQRY